MPSTNTQANVTHADGSVGSAMPKTSAATSSSSAACSVPVTKTWPILPRKYDDGRERRAAEPLQRAVALLPGDVHGEVLHAREQHARGDHAGQVVRADLRPPLRPVPADVARRAERRGEDAEHDDREEEGEEHGVRGAGSSRCISYADRESEARPPGRGVAAGRAADVECSRSRERLRLVVASTCRLRMPRRKSCARTSSR